jgi:hypothetical protein
MSLTFHSELAVENENAWFTRLGVFYLLQDNLIRLNTAILNHFFHFDEALSNHIF